MVKANKCQGRRRQFRGGKWGIFKCTRDATGIIETSVGFTARHYVCDDDSCFTSLYGGYPASFTPISGSK